MSSNQVSIVVLALALFVTTSNSAGGASGRDVGETERTATEQKDVDVAKGPQERQSGGEDYRRYRSRLYDDDDVFGYEAVYPFGEASYINYRSREARARRGPQFARFLRAHDGKADTSKY